jgi:hypothetical protein
MAIRGRFGESSWPATLGSTLAAHLCLIVWCKACRHQVSPTWPNRSPATEPISARRNGPRGCGAQNATAETLISSLAGRGAERLPPTLPRHPPGRLDARSRLMAWKDPAATPPARTAFPASCGLRRRRRGDQVRGFFALQPMRDLLPSALPKAEVSSDDITASI